MKIAIFGTGGVGGYLGGLLALGGEDVTFIARGDHLAAIKETGLQVRSVNGDFTISPAQATSDPAEVGEVDYLIVAVKHYHLAQAVTQMEPLVGENTTIVPLLNGVDAHEILAEKFDSGQVVAGLCSLSSMIEAPGVIYQPSKLVRVVVGELDRSKSERLEKLVSVWRGQGADAFQPEDIFVAMWTKFLFIASFGGISALSQANAGAILGDEECRQLFIDAMSEVEDLARAQEINLPANVVDATLEMFSAFEPTTTPSFQRDVAAGGIFELEAFNGKIVHLGRALGVPTPIHRVIYNLLIPYLERAREASTS
jgi:2-dehydropantoate 2-reductase